VGFGHKEVQYVENTVAKASLSGSAFINKDEGRKHGYAHRQLDYTFACTQPDAFCRPFIYFCLFTAFLEVDKKQRTFAGFSIHGRIVLKRTRYFT
jgi:hypothetical protein